MKKIIIYSIITCALTSSSNSLSMLRFLRTQTRAHARMSHTSNPLQLQKENIFNTPELEVSRNMLEDLYNRNKLLTNRFRQHIEFIGNMEKKLHQQEDVVTYHTFNNEPLDIATLKKIEQDLKKDISSLASATFMTYQNYYKAQETKGHANE